MNDKIPANVLMCIKYLQSIDGLIEDEEEIQYYYHRKNNKNYLFVLFQDCYSDEYKEKFEKLLGGDWGKQNNEEYNLMFDTVVIFSCIFDFFTKMKENLYNVYNEDTSLSKLKEEAGKMIRI